jgi:hypothetical protein
MQATGETLRASEDQREHTADLLREHFQQGRLSIDELAERLGVAFAAHTHGELDALLGDLPAQGPQATARALPRNVRAFLLVNALLVGIWLLTGAGYFWPMWPFLGWGIGLAAHLSRPSSVSDRASSARRRCRKRRSGSAWTSASARAYAARASSVRSSRRSSSARVECR